MLLYYITNRSAFGGSESERQARLLDKIEEAARAGVQFIQLREKDLSGRALEKLAIEAVRRVQGTHSKLLVNSRTDIAIAAGAHGVHLRSDDIGADRARTIFEQAGVTDAIIGVSCHHKSEVEAAERRGADLIVFGPVFEAKSGVPAPGGLARLRLAAKLHRQVFALGGVTLENAGECAVSGAAGIAGIRLFQENDIAGVVSKLSAG